MKKVIQILACLIVFYFVSALMLYNISNNVREPMNVKQCFIGAFYGLLFVSFIFWAIVLFPDWISLRLKRKQKK